MRHCQAVVIGGGCGGLAAAAKLKQEGVFNLGYPIASPAKAPG